MPATVAVLAALPREIKGLVRGLQPDPALKRQGIFLYRRSGAVLVAAGMGSSRVTRALEAALQAAPVQLVLSMGLAGACVPDLAPGSLIEPATVIDAQTGERFSCAAGTPDRTLVSTETIASVHEKARLHASYGAAVVDMEAATLARITQAHGVPLQVLKGISDAHDFELASLSRFTGKHGHFRTAHFAWHTALRPATWRATTTLGRHSQQALGALVIRAEEILANGG